MTSTVCGLHHDMAQNNVLVGVTADHEIVAADCMETIAFVEAARAVVVDIDAELNVPAPRLAAVAIAQSIRAAAMPAPCPPLSTYNWQSSMLSGGVSTGSSGGPSLT